MDRDSEVLLALWEANGALQDTWYGTTSPQVQALLLLIDALVVRLLSNSGGNTNLRDTGAMKEALDSATVRDIVC